MLKQSKGDLKRAEITQAAISIISSEGIDSLTFEAVGKLIGTRKSHIAYYFPNKKELIAACIEFIVDLGLEVIQKHMKKNGNTLESYAKANILWLEKYPQHAPVFMLFLYMATFDETYRGLFEQIRKNGKDRIMVILLEEKQQVPSQKVANLSVAIQNLITSALIEIHTTKKGMKKVSEELLEQIKVQIKGSI